MAGRHVHGREQIRCAVTLVVMGHRRAGALLLGQRWLGPIQRLHLGLFIETEHHGPLR